MLSIVVPTYNERENLPLLVHHIRHTLFQAGIRGNLIIVDDNSPDGTGRIADRLCRENDWIEVIHRPGKQGVTSAYLEGFRRALENGAHAVVQMDADFSHHPRYLVDFARLVQDYDLVLGSRYTAGGGTEGWSRWRWLLSRAGNGYARLVLGLPIADITGGYKCYRASMVRDLLRQNLSVHGFAFQIETIYWAWRSGYRIVEIPITFYERRAGRSKLSRGIFWEAFTTVWKLRIACTTASTARV